MKPTQTEKQLEQWFTKQVELRGGRCLKLSLQGLRGFPDRTVLLPAGEIFFVEFKSETGRLSAQQIVWRKILTGLGFEVFVISNKNDGGILLRK